MGTNNFHKVNADKYYVFTSAIPENDEEKCDWSSNDIRDMLSYTIEDKPKKVKYQYYKDEPKSKCELRSYPSDYLGTFTTILNTNNKEDELQLDIHIYCRAGYYDGICLDWEKQYFISGTEVYESIEYIDDFIYNTLLEDTPKSKIMFDNLLKRLRRREKELIDYIHHSFSLISEPHDKIAQFSNGEAVYQAINRTDD